MIKRIRFDEERMAALGLRTRELANLGPRVVLAGPNGGGKTRYLGLVEKTIQVWNRDRQRREQLRAGSLRGWGLASPQAMVEPDERRPDIEETGGGRQLQSAMLRYLPQTVPAAPEQLSQHKLDEMMRAIAGGDYDAAATGAHVYLEVMARALWHGTHPDQGAEPAIAKEHFAALRFNHLLERLLGAKVEPRIANNGRIVPHLFGQPVNNRALSVGQRVLLCWAILLDRQLGRYIGRIVLIDEPEVYLHPEACARAIAALQGLLGADGQIWIATHSLPLIAWAGTDALHFVDGGEVSYAGTTPARVWTTLLGGDGARDRLLAFLDGDAQAAASRFATECLLDPGVASARPGDPQPGQLVQVVEQRLRAGADVRVLEIGAGRGRLVAAIAEQLRATPALRAGHLRYVAYEDPGFVTDEHRQACQAHLDDLRALGAHARYVTDLAELQAIADERADLVVLANTLHEVPVEDWLRLFDALRAASKPEASLLVIEDQEPRVGELPHPRGFLILEHAEWEALVGQRVPPISQRWNGRRLTAFQIPIASLTRARHNLGHALDLVARRALGEIRQLRARRDTDHRAGRRHAFLAMLHLNATMALQVYPPPGG